MGYDEYTQHVLDNAEKSVHFSIYNYLTEQWEDFRSDYADLTDRVSKTYEIFGKCEMRIES